MFEYIYALYIDIYMLARGYIIDLYVWLLCYVCHAFDWVVVGTGQRANKLEKREISAYLMLIKYWASATDSVFPVMLIVLSRLAGASRSSQFEIRIIAPESCLDI